MATSTHLKLFSFLTLTLALGCSSASTESTTGSELEIVPQGYDECSKDDCEDPPGECDGWSQSGESEGCMLDCPRGGPTAPIAWNFECYEVHVVSCKDLSNVVIELADGEHIKFDGLSGKYGTFGAGEIPIVGAWVKAGNNSSGDGPGYGMRIESDGDECDDGGTGGTGGDGGTGGVAGHPGSGGMIGSGGMVGSGGHYGTGGSGGIAGQGGEGGAGGLCDDDSDSDSDCNPTVRL